MPDVPGLERALTVAAYARRYGVHDAVVLARIRQGELRGAKHEGRWYVEDVPPPPPILAPEPPPAPPSSAHAERLARARRSARRAGVVGAFSAAVTLLLALSDAVGASPDSLTNAVALGDVALLVGLSYGTWRVDRGAAAGLLAYYGLGALAVLAQGAVVAVVVRAVVLGLLAEGVRGAFECHRLRRDEPLAAELDVLAAGAEPAAGATPRQRFDDE